MTARCAPVLAGLLALTLAAAACEPSTITAAKDQLGRGGARTFSLTVPISQDTIKMAKVLGSDTATTAAGLLAIKLDPQILSSAIGQKLQFNGLTFQQFRFSYDQMLTAAPATSNLSFTFAPHLVAPSGPIYAGPPSVSLDTIRFATPAGSGVSAAALQSGLIIARITNGTTCQAVITDSVKDSTGTTVLGFPATSVLPGATVTDTVDAAGVSFHGYLFLGAPTVQPVAFCIPATGETVGIHLTTTPLTLASVTLKNINEPFSQSDTIFANEPRIRAVDSVLVNTGTFTLTVQNRLPISATINLQLNGITRAGAPLTKTIILPAAPGNGSTVTSTTNIDLSGTTIRPKVVVVSVSGSVVAPTALITSATAANAVVVDGGGSLTVQTMWGSLDPTKTPELTLAMEESDEIAKSQVKFGDFEDVIKNVHLNDATAALTITNQAQTPLVLSNVKLGVVRLNASGQLTRDGFGNPAYERDSTTNLPILVPLVAHAGDTTLQLLRGASVPVTLQMAPLVDRLVHLLLGNTRVAVVAAGTAIAGDGSPSRIARGDSATVGLALTVALDLTLPDTGVVFKRTEYTDGADLKASDSATVIERLIAATAITDVVNGTPFGATVDVAIVRDSVAETVDLFAAPGRVQLGPITVAGSPVDASGRVTTPASSSQSLSLTPADLPPLLGKRFTTQIRIRLRPPPGGGLRGAVRTSDQVIVHSHAAISAHAGGGQ
jgi:hypothetical protein